LLLGGRSRVGMCEGEDLSRPLAWSAVPEDAVSLALTVDDPDAPVGTFTHWLAWGMSHARIWIAVRREVRWSAVARAVSDDPHVARSCLQAVERRRELVVDGRSGRPAVPDAVDLAASLQVVQPRERLVVVEPCGARG